MTAMMMISVGPCPSSGQVATGNAPHRLSLHGGRHVAAPGRVVGGTGTRTSDLLGVSEAL